MRTRLTLVLPVIGLLGFYLVTYGAIRRDTDSGNGTRKYFWWSSIRLDRAPLRTVQPTGKPCGLRRDDCLEWDPEEIWVDPGWIVKTLVISAAPVFIVGKSVVHFLARFGINEVTTFMVAMPLLIFSWYYFLSWILLAFIGEG